MSSEERSASNWQKVRSHVSTIIASRQLQLKQKIINIRRSNIIVEATDWANVPFHLQGRLSLNTNEMINRRLKLRRDPEIVRVLEVWWFCALSNQNAHTAVGKAANLLSKGQYVLLSLKLYRAMVEEWNEVDALAVAEEEWAKDAVDDCMGKEVFMDGIFEFADMYTLGVDSVEYVNFLWKLFWCIARGAPPNGCVWKDDSEIVYHPMDQDEESSDWAQDRRPRSATFSAGGKKGKSRNDRKGASSRKITRELSTQSRLLQPTASSRASDRKNEKNAKRPGADAGGAEGGGSGKHGHIGGYTAFVQYKRSSDKEWRPTKLDAAGEAGLAAALTRRASLASAASATPRRSSLRSSMRRQSLAIDKLTAATAAMVEAAAAGPKSKPRRASILLSETIHITTTAVKHITLRALQSRPKVNPEPLASLKYKTFTLPENDSIDATGRCIHATGSWYARQPRC